MFEDFIYYIVRDGKVIEDLIFESEEAARQFAIESEYENFDILEWDVS